MSPLVVLGVGLVGGVGALGRFVLHDAVDRRTGHAFPFGTLAVNVSGAFALGLLVGLGPAADVQRILGTGLLGAFTTFSAWALESHRLSDEGRPGHGAANFVVSLGLGLGAAWAGRRLGVAL